MEQNDEQPAKADPNAASGSPPGPSARHGAHHALLFGVRKVPPRFWWIGAAVVVGIAIGGILLFLYAGIEWAALARRIAALSPAPLLVAMATLPLVGFPILPVYLVAGARFGAVGGGVAVTVITAAHLVGTYVIARTFLRAPLLRLLRRWHTHLPDVPADEEAAVALIAALVPGIPYVVRNYILAVAGLRLRSYFWVCLPIYVARSYVSILVGNLGTAPDRNRLLILGAVELAKAVVCALVIWWLREHHRRVHGADPGGASHARSA